MRTRLYPPHEAGNPSNEENFTSRYELVILCVTSVVSFTLCLTLVACIGEYLLRTLAFSSGFGIGGPSQRWNAIHWKPINQHGYRDAPIDINSEKKQIVFLGDSFTAGAGVRFEETYAFLMRNYAPDRYQVINLGWCGASTQKETKNFSRFMDDFHPRLEFVFHQHFGNDIEDYSGFPNVTRDILPRALTARSELAQFIESVLVSYKLRQSYSESLFRAYDNPEIFQKHLLDIRKLHDLIRANGGKVIFLIFPFLSSQQALEHSTSYIQGLKSDFLKHCKPGDYVLDVSGIASHLSTQERVVNFMDGHPSPQLHEMVAKTIASIVGPSYKSEPAITSCPQLS
jgi:hypothetical protein